MKNRAGIFALIITGVLPALLLANILVRAFYLRADSLSLFDDCTWQMLQPLLKPGGSQL